MDIATTILKIIALIVFIANVSYGLTYSYNGDYSKANCSYTIGYGVLLASMLI